MKWNLIYCFDSELSLSSGDLMILHSNLQLKEMVLATLSESGLSISDDDVEAIVDKVVIC